MVVRGRDEGFATGEDSRSDGFKVLGPVDEVLVAGRFAVGKGLGKHGGELVGADIVHNRCASAWKIATPKDMIWAGVGKSKRSRRSRANWGLQEGMFALHARPADLGQFKAPKSSSTAAG